MTVTFYISAAVALAAAIRVISLKNAVHALLHLVIVILAMAVMFYVLGAPFLAALQVVVYAGAIIMLFLFVVMMLAPGKAAEEREERWMTPKAWGVPIVMALILAAEVGYLLLTAQPEGSAGAVLGPREVSASLYRNYLVGVELSSVLLLVGMIGAYYLGLRREEPAEPDEGGGHHG